MRIVQKILIFSLLYLIATPFLFSQSENGSKEASFIGVGESSNIEGFYAPDETEDVDMLFENAEDKESAVITEDVKSGTDYNIQVGSLKFPIEVSGNMLTEFGGAFLRESMANDATVYFDFKNYIYFTTRPDKYLALKGVLKTSMPKDDSDSETNNLLYLYEMYFDYLMLDRIYITAGKKKTVWGNIRLFADYYDNKNEDDDNYDKDDNVNDAQFTNILYDSRRYLSGIIKIPFGNHTFTGIAMYNDESSKKSPGTRDMSIAASAEFIIFNTSINLFGRRFPLKNSTDAENYQLPIAGVEFKRSILGFDLYGQSMARISDSSKAGDIFASNFDDLSAIKRIVSTAGTYRLWSGSAPYVGFNFEFQSIYRPNPTESEKYFTNRFAFEVGMAKLGPAKDIKLALQWNHNITDKTGFVKSGIIFSRIMPHCDWRNGVKYEYGDENMSFNKYKLTIGSYLTINLDY